MNANYRKEQVQKQACKEWWKHKQATVIMHTGTGKTFTFFRCLMKSKAKQCLFLAETELREKTVLDDAVKFEEIYGVNPLEGLEFKFMCYHSGHKHSIKTIFPKGKVFVCADEVHELCTKIRWQFVNNTNWQGHFFLGLTATLDKQYSDELEASKWDFLSNKFPICLEYNIDLAKQDGTTRNLEIWTILHQLDQHKKTITAGNKTTSWLQTEQDAYKYLNDAFKKTLWLSDSNPSKKFLLRNSAARRATFLYNLPSKVALVKELLSILPGRTLVFGLTNESLLQLGIPAIVTENPTHREDLERFQRKEINQISGNKMLEQGANLVELDNIIYMSYYRKEGKTKQRAGRLRTDLPHGKIIIVKTIGTQEEKWYDEMIQPLLVFTQKTTQNIKDIV